jgi:cytoskeleton protein RodZ
MSEVSTPEQGELGILRVGDRLRMAREGAGLSIIDVANRTRITQRHLDAIERSDFDSLPGRTYVTGFARAYARAVGLSDVDIARDVRTELEGGAMRPREIYEAYEPADPARVPSRRLAWTMLAVIAVLATAYAVWRTLALDSSSDPTSMIVAAPAGDEAAPTGESAANTPAPAPTAPADAKVVLTGIGEVWIGFDDAQGKTENWRTLDPGEELTVPAAYLDQFTLRTAKPQMLKVTVDGRDVGPIGPTDMLVKGVSLKPSDLLARASSAATSAPPAPAR